MIRSRRFKLLVSVSFILLVAILTFGYTSFFREDVQEDLDEEVLGLGSGVSGIPFIVSLPPISVMEGELYEYRVSAVHKDFAQEDLFLEYIEGPDWLELDDMVLRGVPPEGSVGTYKIVLRVSDGYNSSTQEEYILVQDLVEGNE